MYERRKYMLEVNDQTRDLMGRDVETYAFADGRFQIRWKGVSLPYRVFDKNQRVTHAAVTSHKLFGDQLAMIKEMQEEMDAQGPPRKARMKTNSEKIGYVKTGKKSPGRPPLARRKPKTETVAPS